MQKIFSRDLPKNLRIKTYKIIILLCGTWSSHGGDYEKVCLLGCSAVKSGRNVPTFEGLILEAASSSDVLADFYQTMRCYNPKGSHLYDCTCSMQVWNSVSDSGRSTEIEREWERSGGNTYVDIRKEEQNGENCITCSFIICTLRKKLSEWLIWRMRCAGLLNIRGK